MNATICKNRSYSFLGVILVLLVGPDTLVDHCHCILFIHTVYNIVGHKQDNSFWFQGNVSIL